MKSCHGVILKINLSPYGNVRPVRYVCRCGRALAEILEPFDYRIDKNRTKEELEILKRTQQI